MQAEETAVSNLAAIMGRESAYTGKTVTWDEISAASLNYMPEKLELGPMDMGKYTVPVPAKPKRHKRIFPQLRSGTTSGISGNKG